MIRSALSAGPEAVSKDATVATMDGKTLKAGTNGWTCIPDGPSPGVDPMCLDKNGMEWAGALMAHKDLDRIPVVKEGALVGILARSDLVRKVIGSVKRQS